jgi:hypothetical protein
MKEDYPMRSFTMPRLLSITLLLALLIPLLGQPTAHAAPSLTQVFEIRAVHSGKCLDVRAASLENRAIVQQYTCQTNENQLWYVSFNNDGTYTYDVTAVHSGKCLDIRGASLENQALAQQYTCHEGKNQRWKLIPIAENTYYFRALHSNKCLDIRGASLANRAVAQQFKCTGGNNQRFTLVARYI